MGHWRRGALAELGIAGLLAAACGTAGASPSSSTAACEPVRLAAALHVDPEDPRGMWGTDLDSERVISVRPRPGLAWQVEAGPDGGIVVDAKGTTVTVNGEIFRQACFDAATSTYFIGPEDLPDPNRPPN